MNKQYRYAILGATSHTKPVIAALKNSEQTILVGVSSEVAAFDLGLAAGELQPTAALLEQKDVDVVFVAGNNEQHYKLAKQALQNGKHVVVARPFTSHKVGAGELFTLANVKQKLLIEAQPGLCLPLINVVKDALADGKIGALRFAEVKGYYALADQAGWFLSLAKGGGALNLGGSYPLQLLPYLTDSPVSEWSGHCVNAIGQADTTCSLSFKVADVLVNCLIATGFEGDSNVTLVGTKGKIEIPQYWHASTAKLIKNDEVQQLSAPNTDALNEYSYLFAHVADCLENDLFVSPRITPQRTVAAMTIIEELYQRWYGDPLN